MPKWNSKCSFVFVFFMKLNLPKSKFYIKFWENWSIMKMSYKVSLVRYRIPYPFESLTQRLVINNNSRSTSFNFQRLLNIESCTTPRRLALSNKSFISSLQYSNNWAFIWIGLASIGIWLSSNPSTWDKETLCFFLFQEAFGT